MQEKVIARYLSNIMLTSLLFLFVVSYGQIAYIPNELKECVRAVNLVQESSGPRTNLQELAAIIEENRVLASEDVTRGAIEEALQVIKAHEKNSNDNNDWKGIRKYLKKYRNNLSEASLLLAMEGSSEQTMSWPLSFVTRSLPADSVGADMIYLSAELALKDNLLLCGSGYVDSLGACLENSLRSIKENKDKDSSINFHVNSMTSSLGSNPTIIFGTGVASPVVNAWKMSSSSNTQSPINIHFSIPGDLKKKKAVSLELHFLVKRQPVAQGNARIRVKAKYMGNNEDFNLLAPNPVFTDTTDSDDFLITEPVSPANLRYVRVIIPLENSKIRRYDLAILSLTRIAPEQSPEYGQDIYLAAAAFRYTQE